MLYGNPLFAIKIRSGYLSLPIYIPPFFSQIAVSGNHHEKGRRMGGRVLRKRKGEMDDMGKVVRNKSKFGIEMQLKRYIALYQNCIWKVYVLRVARFQIFSIGYGFKQPLIQGLPKKFFLGCVIPLCVQWGITKLRIKPFMAGPAHLFAVFIITSAENWVEI